VQSGGFWIELSLINLTNNCYFVLIASMGILRNSVSSIFDILQMKDLTFIFWRDDIFLLLLSLVIIAIYFQLIFPLRKTIIIWLTSRQNILQLGDVIRLKIRRKNRNRFSWSKAYKYSLDLVTNSYFYFVIFA
jgi:hypothetical protein